MQALLSALHSIAEYETALKTLNAGESAAITGVGQINRSHMIAGLLQDTRFPLVVLCQDDLSARRLQEELHHFTGQDYPILPGRELTLYDAVVSRSWEQKRLRQLYELAQGNVRLQIVTWEGMSQRTIPPETLLKAAFTLKVGGEYPLEQLTEKLIAAGYSRCGMVEGSGQFAVRGGIVDIYSPAMDGPVRAEFWGDELFCQLLQRVFPANLQGEGGL